MLIININIFPEYGRGYYKQVGKKSDLFVLGKLIDQDNTPISLMYIEITGLSDNNKKLLFTNSKGGFEFQVEKQQKYKIKVNEKTLDRIKNYFR